MTHISIRLRLTIWYAAVLALGLAMFGGALGFALERRLMADVDAHLAMRIQNLRKFVAAELELEINSRAYLQHEVAEFAASVSDTTLIVVRDRSGVSILPVPKRMDFPQGAAAEGIARSTTNQAGEEFRILAGRMEALGESYDILAADSLEEVVGTMRGFRQISLGLIPGVLLLACAGGYWLSSRALRPVDEITLAVKSISLRSLSRRIAVPQTGDGLQRMAETWNEVLERLDLAVQRVRQFTADASHELRSPLALIRATAELALRRERGLEEYRASLRAIEQQADLMTQLTESMLTIARADFEGFDLPLCATDLHELVISVVQQSQAMAAEKEIHLDVLTEGRPIVAQGNVTGLRSLLRILIDNALKHTPAGGQINVSATMNHDSAVLAVQDTGEGISAADLPHIFERFYRSDPARAAGSGFGLGLSIARAIAQAHGSEIAVESSPGRGARFSVALRV